MRRHEHESLAAREVVVGSGNDETLLVAEETVPGFVVALYERGARVGGHCLKARIDSDEVGLVGRDHGGSDEEALLVASLEVVAERVAILAVHKDVTPALEFVQDAKFDVDRGGAGSAAGTQGDGHAARLKRHHDLGEAVGGPLRCVSSLCAPFDVLQVPPVALGALETQLGVRENLLDDAQRLLYVGDPRSTEAHVDVTEHTDVGLSVGGPCQFDDALDTVNDDQQRTARRQFDRASRERLAGEGRGNECRNARIVAVGAERDENGLCLGEFGDGEPHRSGIELASCDVGGLV